MTKRFVQKQLPRVPYWLLVALIIGGRLLIAWCQRVRLTTDSAPLDDMLMINAARSIVNGEWLGAYGPYILAKNMGYAVWLALLHVLRIPVLLAQAALWVGASFFAARALRPLLPGNLARLCLFAFLVFNPVSFAVFNLRVYRDAIFPAFCLLLFAGAVGLALRLPAQRLRGSVGMAVGAGVGLMGCWLLREDGLVLLIFAVAALLCTALYALWGQGVAQRLAKTLFTLVPLACMLCGVLVFSAFNKAHYGVFRVNDMNGGSFTKAYGAMTGVSRAVSGPSGVTPVTAEALDLLYDEVPSMAPLREHLEAGPAFNGFANKESGEYGGSFYFALRVAASLAGEMPDGATAQEYWQTVAGEINAAVEAGRLPSAGSAGSVVPRWYSGLLGATAEETVYSALTLLTLEDCDPRPEWSDGPEEDVAAVAAFLHSKVQQGYAEGTGDPYYNPVQRLVFGFCDVLTPLYAVALWVLLAFAVVRVARVLAHGVRGLVRRSAPDFMFLLAVLALGLFLSFLLRMVVSAYMEVASFRIGTYLMYLSSGMPALLLFGAVGFALPAPPVRKVSRLHPLAYHNGRRDLRLGWVIALAVLLLAGKLLLAGAQQVYLDLGAGPIDDDLAIAQAMGITAGNWLGEYNWLTLAKHSFFSLWLSWLHAVGIPFLLGGQLLWAAAAGVAALALRPVLKSRWLTLCLFGVLLFNPASTANPTPYAYITRVYRDNIFPALCVLCMAGAIGFALRWRRGLPRLLPWLLASGLGLAGAWLTREDGWWLLPFMAAATAIAVIFILQSGEMLRTRIAKCAAALLPFAVLGASLLGWAAQNQAHYGVFVVSDFSSGSFAEAYGAMTRIKHEDWNPKVAVPADVRAQLYRHVPEFAEFEFLLETPYYTSRYAADDYSSGSFYWALREAAWELGHYETAGQAQAFFARLAGSINALIDDGTLTADVGARVSVNPPIRAAYILPVVGRTFENLWYAATFEGTNPRSLLSINDTGRSAAVEEYLHEAALVAAVENSDQPYYNPGQSLRFRILDIFAGVYAVALPLALLAALAVQCLGARRMFHRMRRKTGKDSLETMTWFVGLGLLASIGLRAAMIAFVDVSSFTIGIYIAYLATIHPLMLLYGFGGTVLLARWLRVKFPALGQAASHVQAAPLEITETPKQARMVPSAKAGRQAAGPKEKRPGKAGQKNRRPRGGRVVYKPGGED